MSEAPNPQPLNSRTELTPQPRLVTAKNKVYFIVGITLIAFFADDWLYEAKALRYPTSPLWFACLLLGAGGLFIGWFEARAKLAIPFIALAITLPVATHLLLCKSTPLPKNLTILEAKKRAGDAPFFIRSRDDPPILITRRGDDKTLKAILGE